MKSPFQRPAQGLTLFLLMGLAAIASAHDAGAPGSFSQATLATVNIELTLTSPLPRGNVPLDPLLDCDRLVREAGARGVPDPNSFEVRDLISGKPVPFGRTEDFAYGNRGHLEWVVRDPSHTRYRIRFRTVATRPPLRPQAYVPAVGTGDLLRYNAGKARPLALPYPARLVDLTGDGVPDLLGCWNYAYRPGWPWDGIVCYSGIAGAGGGHGIPEFGDLQRLRFVKDAGSSDFQHFVNIYQGSDAADFDGDGLPDLVWCPANSDRLHFYRNSGRRDPGGMPVFVDAGDVPRQTREWTACRAVDLDRDGAMDVTIGDLWLRNTGGRTLPPRFGPAVTLNVSGVQCWFDVDRDGNLDAIATEAVLGEGLENYRLVWRRNAGSDQPHFGDPRPLTDLNSRIAHPVGVTAVDAGRRQGLLVTAYPNLSAHFFVPTGAGRFKAAGTARSRAAVLSLGDQAWPHFCDWEGDGDLDLLVGGGYGWPQLVLNRGTAAKPAWSEPQFLYSEGKPIRLTRDALLGGECFHDMGYPYPAYVDWDGDRLPDLLLPNETNRIYWYRNVGSRRKPRFGPRQQILCDGYPDSPALRLQSATRAVEPNASAGVYPYEPEQPFFWRTGAAFSDWNGDGLTDFITHDGFTRIATLFAQYRSADGSVHLRKDRVLRLTDCRPINDAIVGRSAHWTESFRAVDWDSDGLMDLVYSLSGPDNRTLDGGSIYLLRNVGTRAAPLFAAPRAFRCYGEPIKITNHGPHPWAGDLDGDGLPDLVACVEWSVYPFYSHAALEMPSRPDYRLRLLPKAHSMPANANQPAASARQP